MEDNRAFIQEKNIKKKGLFIVIEIRQELIYYWRNWLLSNVLLKE